MGKYSAQFTSIKGVTYTLEIAAEWLQDKTLVLDVDPVHLVVSEAKTKFPGLRTTECEINVLSDDPMTELYNEDIMTVTVMLKHGDEVDFVGFLETSEWEMPCAPGMIEAKQLVAVDALSVFLKKNCYDRSYTRMINIMEEVKAEMNALLPVNIVFEGELLATEEEELTGNSIYQSFVNIDSLQPADLYESHDVDGNWMKWGEIIDEFAKATGSTIMLNGTHIKAYYVDREPNEWCNELHPMETRLTNTEMSIKMVGSARRIEQEIKTLRNVDDPDVVDSTYARVKNDAGDWALGKAVLYHYAEGFEKYWDEAYPWPINDNPHIQPVCAISESDDETKLDPESKSTWIVGIEAVSKPARIYPDHRTDGGCKLIIKADIHINFYKPNDAHDPKWVGVPRIWEPSAVVSNHKSSSQYYDESPIFLKFDRFNVHPYLIRYEETGKIIDLDEYRFTTENNTWYTMYFYFDVPANFLAASGHKLNIRVSSPDLGRYAQFPTSQFHGTIGYTFAKNIRIVGPGYDADKLAKTPSFENKTLRVEASGTEFGQVMRFDCKMCNEPWYAGYINAVGIYLNRDPLQQLANQYRVPHQQWTGTADDEGFDPTKKVWCRGSLCTQIASDRNLRDSEVTATVMD